MTIKATEKTARPKKKSTAEILRERKIEACQERLTHGQESIEAMESERNALAATDIVGLSVTHKQFGEGRIIEKSHGTIAVDFGFAKKKFVMPSAFLDGFLSTSDPETNEKLTRYQNLGEDIKMAKNDMYAAGHLLQALMNK